MTTIPDGRRAVALVGVEALESLPLAGLALLLRGFFLLFHGGQEHALLELPDE